MLSNFKYIPYFPYIFYYFKLKENKSIDINKIPHDLQPCDIVLRRYTRYIDGIIFSENSYFTHAGIYAGDIGDKKSQVWHATGEKGVDHIDLEKFCDCDHIAVLRFSLGDTDEEGDIRKYIKGQRQTLTERPDLKQDELAFFNDLLKKSKVVAIDPEQKKSFTKQYRELILSRAGSLKKMPYDYKFDFENFDTFSCIEYVWYCYKCLFPFHRIRVKDFEFFNWVKMPVIIPDVFIKNDFFETVWTNVPHIKGKKDLKKFVRKDRNHFWLFCLSIFIWNILVLLGYHFLVSVKH